MKHLLLVSLATVASAQYKVTGIVLEDRTGLPVADVQLSFHLTDVVYGSVESDNQGRFSKNLPHPGPYWIELRRAGYSFPPGVSFEVRQGSEQLPLTIRLKRGMLSGRLLMEDGTPIVGASIKCSGNRETASTDREGRFSFSMVDAGRSLELRARLDVKARATLAKKDPRSGVTLGPPEISKLSIDPVIAGTPVENIEFRIRPVQLASLSGVVDDLGPWKNAEGVSPQIELLPSRQGSYYGDGEPKQPLAANREFKFELLTAGDYVIRVSRNSSHQATAFEFPIRILEGVDLTSHRIVLPQTAKLFGKAKWPDGFDPTNVKLSALTAGGSSYHADFRPDGSFQFPELSPGAYSFSIMFLNFRPGAQTASLSSVRQGNRTILPGATLQVIEGDNPPLEVVFGSRFQVTGRIFDSQMNRATPVKDSSVHFFTSTPYPTWYMRVADTGRFDAMIPAGEFIVYATTRATAIDSRSAPTCPQAIKIVVTEDIFNLDLFLCK
jgi:hypothetical protein